MPDELTEAKVAEAAHAVAVAHEANSNAREAQMHDAMVKALTEVMVAGERDNLPVLIRRVPFLCKSVEAIKESQNTLEQKQDKMSNDMRWIIRLGSGILAIGGLLAAKALGV